MTSVRPAFELPEDKRMEPPLFCRRKGRSERTMQILFYSQVLFNPPNRSCGLNLDLIFAFEQWAGNPLHMFYFFIHEPLLIIWFKLRF
jgi:hypothetical protein